MFASHGLRRTDIRPWKPGCEWQGRRGRKSVPPEATAGVAAVFGRVLHWSCPRSNAGTIDFEPNFVAPASRFRPAIAVLLLVAYTAQPVCAEPDSGDLLAQYRQLSERYQAASQAWYPKSPASGALLFIAPDEYSPRDAPNESTQEARNEYAGALFELAKQAADTGQMSLAFQWATETLRENPDHADARRVLGYEQRDGQWLTAYGVKMFDDGKTWNPKLGWVAVSGDDSRERASRSGPMPPAMPI